MNNESIENISTLFNLIYTIFFSKNLAEKCLIKFTIDLNLEINAIEYRLCL